jgi:DNA recombination protein RmuC
MIQIGEQSYSFSDPLVIVALIGAGGLILLVLLLMWVLRRAGRSAQVAEILAQQMSGMSQKVQGLSDGQHQLFGGLTSVTEAQAQQQARTIQLMEKRLQAVT